ncbi:MAG: crossover junction endodeoxyribonuclease RuvC [Nitrospinaceae bacterium]|nr:crossover junction endodeoxyribonuclease RuvC [Nitrospinaceae bacterium]NIR55205.1 crossover junction endodeoxyribonuclease RuvC [Nitrospinaceae bacterium]NIS85632.1 crossover junction endodeoxyribonuclease RuvC [Nitrospinaceae bacterium]NIT82477.1 crossover junction endodeoxyribonuclease RuvC [Nitrospinaceae bacterium]NIU44682.1 crossover junction endodeoxyribonuclease RuvC [Nitrospinaceae bacterium]
MGIDPGSLCTGYGIVEETPAGLSSVHFGSIKSSSKHPFERRLKNIYDGLTAVMEEYQPETVAVEDVFFAANAKSSIKLGQTRGVALLAAANRDIALAEYTPLEVKQAVTAYGRADKRQVQDMVATLLKLREKPEPLDASDALAVAICHLNSYQARERLKTGA